MVKERNRVYLLGLSYSSVESFPPRCNMEDKLDSLQEEREYLLDMCPLDDQNFYEEGKEATLVRICF
jgi:hypothetical protein